jgi:pyruvate dehydrogenase E2 component (dihydrolipoamide acetyltransferase)
MRFEMKMPDLATTDSQIRVVRWFIEPGQKVERGQPLLEVETDKATMEVESVVSGVLKEVQAAINVEVSVGQVIAVLEIEDPAQRSSPAAPPPNDLARLREGEAPAEPSEIPQLTITSTAWQEPRPPEITKPGSVGGNPKGMFARNRSAAASPVKNAGIPLSIAQRTAAKRLLESKQTMPHFYLQTSFNAAAVIARRNAAGPVKPAWDAFFVQAVARAIGKFDRFRCRFDGERLAAIESDGIGVAIDHEGELYVIPVAAPTSKSVEQISEEIRRNVKRLQENDPEMRKIRPALMTVTNLGVCNVEGFIPIINPPESAILGIGKVLPTPVAKANGQTGVEHRATLTLSVDHRVASGKYAGDFLGEIVRELESF